MLITTLLLLATRVETPKSVLLRFRDFMVAHPQITVDVKIETGRGGGTGQLVLVRLPKPNGAKVDWHAVISGQPFDFIASGPTVLELNNPARLYDRHPSNGDYSPAGRISVGAGFPSTLTMLALPFARGLDTTTVAPKAGGSELSLTVHSMEGVFHFTADFGADGRLTYFKTDRNGATQADTFTNYKFDGAHSKSGFSVDPPLGYSPFIFDEPVKVLRAGTPLSVKGIPASGKYFVAFIDDLIPDGLAATLKNINAKVPVIVVSLQSANSLPGKFKFIHASEADFDKAGIEMTPQFYLVESGKTVQGWQGFVPATAAKFQQEVLTFQAGQ